MSVVWWFPSLHFFHFFFKFFLMSSTTQLCTYLRVWCSGSKTPNSPIIILWSFSQYFPIHCELFSFEFSESFAVKLVVSFNELKGYLSDTECDVSFEDPFRSQRDTCRIHYVIFHSMLFHIRNRFAVKWIPVGYIMWSFIPGCFRQGTVSQSKGYLSDI
jgi:hypothetical protein